MPKTIIRALKPEDMPQMKALFQTRDDVDRVSAEEKAQLFEWLAFKNPYANGEPTYFVAVDGDKIVAHLGRMPMEFYIRGKTCKGYYVHDLYVHPKYREKGRGFFISNSLYKTIEEQSDSFCCLVWTTELNLGLQRRRGYHETSSDRYYKFLDPYPKMKKIVRSNALAKILSAVLKIVLRSADAILFNLRRDNIKIKKMSAFDSRFDTLAPQVIQKSGICPVKSQRYLSWRFQDRPFGNMELFVAQENGYVSGFVVTSLTVRDGRPEGILVDLMADPDDSKTLAALVKSAVQALRAKNVCAIRCCLSDRRFARILKRFLFFRDFIKQDPVMMANLDKFTDKEYLKDIANWHITCGASDELMLEPLVPTSYKN